MTAIAQAFRTALTSIKPIDGVWVGMFPNGQGSGEGERRNRVQCPYLRVGADADAAANGVVC